MMYQGNRTDKTSSSLTFFHCSQPTRRSPAEAKGVRVDNTTEEETITHATADEQSEEKGEQVSAAATFAAATASAPALASTAAAKTPAVSSGAVQAIAAASSSSAASVSAMETKDVGSSQSMSSRPVCSRISDSSRCF